MNYQKLYDRIIENRQQNPINEGYTENHHILPESLGGQNNPDNMVRLSAREHFICHYLLAKIYKKETFEWYKMNHAFLMMKSESMSQKRYFNSRLYEALKGNFSTVMSLSQSGKGNSQYGTMWICDVEKRENKKISKQDLELWISKGWVKGRTSWGKKSSQLDESREEKEIMKICNYSTRLSNYRYLNGLKMLKFIEYIEEGGKLTSLKSIMEEFDLPGIFIRHALKFKNVVYEEKRGGFRKSLVKNIGV